MRQQIPAPLNAAQLNAAQRLRIWPALVVNAEIAALVAAIGLIAAITIYAPQLQLP